MSRAYNVVDADGHILEPLDLWDKYIDPAFRDRAPRIVKGENGTERLIIEEHGGGDGQRGIGRIGAVGARRGALARAWGFNEGGRAARPRAALARCEGRGPRHIITHTMEMMLACLAVIWGGVCERHPKIRIGFLESGGGWIAPWLDRMDRHFDDQGFNDSGLTTRPSELFQRNCWISFEPVEGSLKVPSAYIVPHKIMWA